MNCDLIMTNQSGGVAEPRHERRNPGCLNKQPGFREICFGKDWSAFGAVVCADAFAEEQGNAPKACDAYDGIDNATDHCSLTTEQISNKVKTEKAHQQPVDAADDGDHKGSAIQHD